ncbi:MAG: hypothetical protein QOD25_890, partial [Alphaproteobacteria bacterium]|nr:hypothetical protein [Alphaproteobacteria bacterium]
IAFYLFECARVSNDATVSLQPELGKLGDQRLRPAAARWRFRRRYHVDGAAAARMVVAGSCEPKLVAKNGAATPHGFRW